MSTKQALLLIDLQNDFCPGGALSVDEGDQVLPVANGLITAFQTHGDMIVASQDWHPPGHGSFASSQGMRPFSSGFLNGLPQTWWPDHCVAGSTGADFHSALNRTALTHVVRKGCQHAIDSYSAFFDNGQREDTGLADWLFARDITRLTVLGLATDYCVKFTVLDALRLGFEVQVIKEGCRAVNLHPNDSDRAFEAMTTAGAIVTSAAALLA